MTVIINKYDETYKTPGALTTAAGIATGLAVSACGENLQNRLVAPALIKNMKKEQKEVDTKVIQKGVQDAFEKSNLKKDGVELLDVRQVKFYEETPEANKKLLESLKKLALSIIPKKFKKDPNLENKLELQLGAVTSTIENGNNAMFIGPNTNKIAVNTEKLGIAAFHEMGHAINYNQSKFWKVVQLTRMPAMLLVGTFALTGICKRKKVDGEEPQGIVDKTTTFIKNNVGKLSALAILPIVAEETMATYRGEKLAKQVLPENTLKSVKKCNRYGLISYVTLAGITGFSAWAASKVRDKIAKPKQII